MASVTTATARISAPGIYQKDCSAGLSGGSAPNGSVTVQMEIVRSDFLPITLILIWRDAVSGLPRPLGV
jgi:hypothetical protein